MCSCSFIIPYPYFDVNEIQHVFLAVFVVFIGCALLILFVFCIFMFFSIDFVFQKKFMQSGHSYSALSHVLKQ